MARSSLLVGLGALALASLALAGCATPSGGTPSQEPTTQEETVDADPDLGAAWLDNGRIIGLVTLGSSTCIPEAESADVSDRRRPAGRPWSPPEDAGLHLGSGAPGHARGRAGGRRPRAEPLDRGHR